MNFPIPPIHTRRPHHVLLFCAILYKQEASLESIEQLLLPHFGSILMRSDSLDFSALTSYYEKEMGPSLRKYLICFRHLYPLETVYQTKLICIGIEDSLRQAGNRQFNIDPGYLTLGKTNMFTTKDFSHRVYIQKGIYGEINLIYSKQKQRYEAWDKTYDDFRSSIFIEFLGKCRNNYQKALEDNILLMGKDAP